VNAPTAAPSLTVTGIPIDITKAYTFSIVNSYVSGATRYNFGNIIIQDASLNYIAGSTSTSAIVPYFNGGPPSSTATTPCLVSQSFSVITIYGIRYVISNVSTLSQT
jgi:hypothetical protein